MSAKAPSSSVGMWWRPQHGARYHLIAWSQLGWIGTWCRKLARAPQPLVPDTFGHRRCRTCLRMLPRVEDA